MNYKKILTFIVLCMLVLTACNQSAYKEAMEQGEAAVDAGDFKAALDYFTIAYEEKESDELQTIMEQTQLVIDAEAAMVEEDIENQATYYEQLIDIKGGLEALTVIGQERLDSLEDIVQSLEELEQLQRAGKNEELIKEIDDLVDNKEEQTWISLMDDELASWKEEAQINQLFSYIEGYGEKEKRPGKEEEDLDQICQISQDDIMCSVLLLDFAAYREIVAVHLENDNSLRIETNRTDLEDLAFTNITPDAYEINGQKYAVVSKEDVEKKASDLSPYNNNIADIFDEEVIKELEAFHFNTNLFEESTGEAEEQVGVEAVLNSYSEEEIEFANVWLDYRGNTEVGATVEFWEKGRPISIPFEEDSAVFLEDVVSISGHSTADGRVVYSSNGDGTINVYDIPYRWPAEYEMEGGVKAYTSKIAESPEKRSVPEGDIIELLDTLEYMSVYR